MPYLTGPGLRNMIRRRGPAHDVGGLGVSYAYTDTRGRTAPEYEATRIRVHAYYTYGAPLEPLEQFLRGLPGCVDIELYRPGARSRLRPRDNNLRAQVIAIFARGTP